MNEEEIKQRQDVFSEYANFCNNLKIKGRTLKDQKQVEIYESFFDELHWFIISNERIPQMFLQPHVGISMDYVQATITDGKIPTFEDAVLAFCFNCDANEEKIDTDASGFVEGDMWNVTALSEYTLSVVEKLAVYLLEQNLCQEEMQQIASYIISKDICSGFFLHSKLNPNT